MFIISRRVGEKILIGTNIEVQVMAVHRTKVRLGVTAPESVSIVRDDSPTKPDETPPDASQ